MRLKLFNGFRPFTRSGVLQDVIAGVTLASMNIPQVLGYARIAGLPVVTGLYTALLAPVAFALLGSSAHLVVAADSGTAAILAAALSHAAQPASPSYLALAGAVALLTAGLLLIARIFKLGFLADFLSRTVLVGFLTGVGLQVGVAMLGDMLGVPVSSHRALVQVWEVAAGLGRLNPYTLGLSSLVIATILLGQRLLPKLPMPLFVVAATIAASMKFGFAEHGVAVIGPIAAGLPSFRLPAVTWNQTLVLLPTAVSCFVVIIAQSAATSRVFAVRYRERVAIDDDILGLAAANAAAALGGAFVVNGSPTQTAMAERAGARGQLAQLVFAASVLVVLLVLTGPLQYLPRCVLSAIVFTIAARMIDISGLRAIRRESPGEFGLALVTTVAVAAVGVEPGVLLAIALSLLRHVSHSYHPHTMVLRPDALGRWTNQRPVAGMQTEPGLILYRFGADLFYANVNRFTDEVRMLVATAPSPVRWFVVEAAAIPNLDFSAAKALRDLLDDLAHSDVKIAFARVGASLESDMVRHGIADLIGRERLFPTLHEALSQARQTETRGQGPD